MTPISKPALLRTIANTYAVNPGASLDGDYATSCGTNAINAVDSANAYWNSKPSGTKLDTVTAAELSDGSPQSRTEFTYDSPLTTGNVTVQRHWDSTKPTAYSIPLTDANSIKSQYTYDASGNVTSSTDPNNNVSSFVVNGCSGSTRSAYPTSVTVGGLTLFTPIGGGIQSNMNFTVNQSATSATMNGTVSGSPAFEANFSVNGSDNQNVPLQNAPTGTIAFGLGLQQTNQINQTVQLKKKEEEEKK